MKKFALLAAVAAASLTACKKDSENTPNKSRTDLLVDKNWLRTDVTATVGSNTASAYTQFFPNSCDRDDLYRFTKPNVLTQDEGPTKCGNGPQTFTNTWSFSNNDTKLTIGTDVFDVSEIQDSSLKLSYTDTYQVNGQPVTATITYIFAKR